MLMWTAESISTASVMNGIPVGDISAYRIPVRAGLPAQRWAGPGLIPREQAQLRFISDSEVCCGLTLADNNYANVFSQAWFEDRTWADLE
jgi:hypothetical protein